MADTGNGAKAQETTVRRGTAADSTRSQTSDKPPTKKTKNGTQGPKIKPVSQMEALEMLRSALVYLQVSGVGMKYRENAAGLLLQLDGVRLDGVRFVVTPKPELVSSVVAIGVTEVV